MGEGLRRRHAALHCLAHGVVLIADEHVEVDDRLRVEPGRGNGLGMEQEVHGHHRAVRTFRVERAHHHVRTCDVDETVREHGATEVAGVVTRERTRQRRQFDRRSRHAVATRQRNTAVVT